jgi:hypothetical protein
MSPETEEKHHVVRRDSADGRLRRAAGGPMMPAFSSAVAYFVSETTREPEARVAACAVILRTGWSRVRADWAATVAPAGVRRP